MTAILRLQLDDKDPVRVNSAINQLAEYIDRNPVPVPSASRTLLTANTTYYVATTGSNSNPGTVGSPFLTIQHAYDVITGTLDLAGHSVTIQCASGTYTTGLSIAQPWSGGGTVTLDLSGGTISSSGDCIAVLSTLPGPITVQNMTLTTSGGYSINNAGSGIISVGVGMTFGATNPTTGRHMIAQGAGSQIKVFNPYTITGGGQLHYCASLSGNTIFGGGVTVTITGTPAFSIFALGTRGGAVDIEGQTFSGGTTGTRYVADSNGIIVTNGGGANYFPGTIAGTPTPGTIGPSGGIYI